VSLGAVSGKVWFTPLRLYSPLESFFTKEMAAEGS